MEPTRLRRLQAKQRPCLLSNRVNVCLETGVYGSLEWTSVSMAGHPLSNRFSFKFVSLESLLMKKSATGVQILESTKKLWHFLPIGKALEL